MKSKIYILWIFFVIFMFLAINTSWARDPMPRSRTSTSYKVDRSKIGGAPTQRGAIHPNNVQRRYEKAKRLAWSDGKFTYQDRRRLHKIRNPRGKEIKRHKGNHRDYTPRHINKRPKGYFIPRFSIGFSFSKPWIH